MDGDGERIKEHEPVEGCWADLYVRGGWGMMGTEGGRGWDAGKLDVTEGR